jgi:lipoprotein NlpI
MHRRTILPILVGAFCVATALPTAAQEAVCHNPNSKPDAGVAACSELISTQKGDAAEKAKAYGWRGYHYNNLGDYDHALTDFSASIVLFPKDAAVYNNRAHSFYAKGQFDRAICAG